MKDTWSYSLSIMLCGIMCAQDASAGAADYVYVPTVEYGEKEIDLKLGETSRLAGNRAQGASLGFGYGAKEYWFTEVYLKQERDKDTIANIAEWENKFQLTDTGQYPVDIGLITELEAPLNSNPPWEFKLGPLFQTEFRKIQLNGNLLFERAFGRSDANSIAYSTTFSYQWQAKYRWQPVLEYGMQGFGEMGKWNHWDPKAAQNHRIGPAVFGKYALGNRQAIRYNAAWLFGISDAAPNHTFRLQVEYEF
jgi:hypothetical protein